MARPPREGLDYFPLDIDFFDDDRIFDLTDRYGSQGSLVYIAMLTIIYRCGYYAEMPAERMAGLIMRSVGTRCFSGRDEVVGILSHCADIGLLDRELYRQGVFTSEAIQRRYAAVTARRSVSINKHRLIGTQEEPLTVCETQTGVIAAETPVDAVSNATKKTKENQTKQNQSKVNQIRSDQTAALPEEGCGQENPFHPSEEILTDDPMMDMTGMTDEVTSALRSILPERHAAPDQLGQLRELCCQWGTERVLSAVHRALGYRADNLAAYVRRMLANGPRGGDTAQREHSPSPPSLSPFSFGMIPSEYSMEEAERLMDEDWLRDADGW